MYGNWIEHIGLGAGITILASIALLFMAYRELAVAGGLDRRGRVLLTAGVGLGVLSFASKVAILGVMVCMPDATILPLMRLHQANRPGLSDGFHYVDQRPIPARASYVWRALPGVAPGMMAKDAAARVELGRQLFHDKRLSRDHSVACASCHDVASGAGTDGRATSVGIDGQVGGRNAPTVWNAAFQTRLFWDGRAPSLEEQAKGPPVNPIEMGMHNLDEVVAGVAAVPAYRVAYASLRGDDHVLTIADVVGAIAAYERTLITDDTPYDRYLLGDKTALDSAQRRGMKLFESVGCVLCHHGPNFSSASVFEAGMPFRLFPAFQNDYIGRYGLGEDPGRAPKGIRAVWKVPSLRNVGLTAPYFHNGRVAELEEAVRVMAVSQLGRHIVATESDKQTSLDLSEAEVRDVAAFLHAFSSQRLAARDALP